MTPRGWVVVALLLAIIAGILLLRLLWRLWRVGASLTLLILGLALVRRPGAQAILKAVARRLAAWAQGLGS